MANTRLMRDVGKLIEYLRELKIEEPEFYNDDIYKLKISFDGPKDSLYERCNLQLWFEMTSKYPEKFPSLTFANKIYHPSVDYETGKMCLDILTSSNWTMSSTLTTVFKRVLEAIMYPDTDNPVNVQALCDLRNNKELFKNLVSNK